MNKQPIRLITLVFLTNCTLNAIDNPHFYRATNFLVEFYMPRLAYPWLSSADFMIGYGSTDKARDALGNKVPLFDLYGPSNMQELGVGVPGKSMTNPGDIILTQLAMLPINDGFGKLSFDGRFKIIEANLSFSQNVTCGFFAQAHLPVRNMRVTNVHYCDLSPTDCSNGPSQSTPVWQSFLANFTSILAHYDLSINPVKKTGIGDLTLMGGWTTNYEDTQEIDYFDASFRGGVLFPTGKKKNVNEVFDFAFGYDGHYAIPITFDAAVGWYDWLTMGGHFGAMPFVKRTRMVRMKTDCNQNGIITLAKGEAEVTPGTIWEVNAYFLADHVLCGFSLLLGYSFAQRSRDLINPCDRAIFDPLIVNSDGQFRGWKMHTVNLIADWDFSDYECPWWPHIGAYGNFVVGGEHIFDTPMGGLEFGLNFACDF